MTEKRVDFRTEALLFLMACRRWLMLELRLKTGRLSFSTVVIALMRRICTGLVSLSAVRGGEGEGEGREESNDGCREKKRRGEERCGWKVRRSEGREEKGRGGREGSAKEARKEGELNGKRQRRGEGEGTRKET